MTNWFTHEDFTKQLVAWVGTAGAVALVAFLLIIGVRPGMSWLVLAAQLATAIGVTLILRRTLTDAARTYAETRNRENHKRAIALMAENSQLNRALEDAERKARRREEKLCRVANDIESIFADNGITSARSLPNLRIHFEWALRKKSEAEARADDLAEKLAYASLRENAAHLGRQYAEQKYDELKAQLEATPPLDEYLQSIGADVVSIGDWLAARRKGREGGPRAPQYMPLTWRTSVESGCRAERILWIRVPGSIELPHSNPPGDSPALTETPEIVENLPVLTP